MAKNTVNMSRTRTQKEEASTRYQELNREVKRRCRRDRMVFVESEAERAEEAGKRGEVFVRDHQKAKWKIPEYV